MKTQLFLFALLLTSANAARAEDTSAATATPDSAAAVAPAKPMKKSKKAKKSASTAIEAPKVMEVSIPMARGQLEAEVAADVAQRERANAPHTKVELGASTWKPTLVTTGSRISNVTPFQTKGIPSIDASFFTPIAGRQLHLQFGLGVLALERTGSISATGISVPQQQNGYAMSLRLGLAYSPWMLLSDRVTPYVSGAILPSMFITRTSAFDDGVSDTGMPFEIGAGTLVRITKPISLDVGVTEELGKVQDSDFKGFGVRAGVRVSI